MKIPSSSLYLKRITRTKLPAKGKELARCYDSFWNFNKKAGPPERRNPAWVEDFPAHIA
jgi:hypothetical protein